MFFLIPKMNVWQKEIIIFFPLAFGCDIPKRTSHMPPQRSAPQPPYLIQNLHFFPHYLFCWGNQNTTKDLDSSASDSEHFFFDAVSALPKGRGETCPRGPWRGGSLEGWRCTALCACQRAWVRRWRDALLHRHISDKTFMPLKGSILWLTGQTLHNCVREGLLHPFVCWKTTSIATECCSISIKSRIAQNLSSAIKNW